MDQINEYQYQQAFTMAEQAQQRFGPYTIFKIYHKGSQYMNYNAFRAALCRLFPYWQIYLPGVVIVGCASMKAIDNVEAMFDGLLVERISNLKEGLANVFFENNTTLMLVGDNDPLLKEKYDSRPNPASDGSERHANQMASLMPMMANTVALERENYNLRCQLAAQEQELIFHRQAYANAVARERERQRQQFSIEYV